MSELKFKVIKGKKRVAYEMVYRDFWQWCYANENGEPNNHFTLGVSFYLDAKRLLFTGFKDKNGKEIYEKDIIACNFLGRNIDDYGEVRQVMHTLEWDKKYSLGQKFWSNPFRIQNCC